MLRSQRTTPHQSLTRFNWLEFCNEYGIHFVTGGPNTARGNINIRCPMCGDDDPSQHMGLSIAPESPVWGCWRNPDHRGTHPLRLIQALLRCRRAVAEQIIAAFGSRTASERLDRTRPLPQQADRPQNLQMPPEFRPITEDGFGGRFTSYLKARGFPQWEEIVYRYELLYAILGDYKWRVIFPVYVDQRLVTWTARSISPTAEVRYKMLPKLESIKSCKETLYRIDGLRDGGDTLVVTEGPFDALKIDAFSGPKTQATCLFGTGYTEKQKLLLASLARGFRRVDLMLDQGARNVSVELAEELKELAPRATVRVVEPPVGVKDPGDMTRDEVESLYPQ